MHHLRGRFSALDRLGVPRLDELLSELSDTGADNLGTFDAEADDTQLRDFARWLGGATPDQIRQAAGFLHQLRPPIVRTLIGWVRTQNSPPVEPLTLEEPDEAITLDLDAPPPAAAGLEPLPLEEPVGENRTAARPVDPRVVGLWGRVKSGLNTFWSGLADLVSPGQARRAHRRLDRARRLFEFDPEAALDEFDELARRAERRRPRAGSLLAEVLRQAHLGRTRCHIAARAFDDAADTEAHASRWGPLTSDEQTGLCQAVLGVLPESLPDYAVEVFARYVLLPDAQPAVRDSATRALRQAVEPSDDRQGLTRAAEIGQRLLARSPEFGWVYFPHALVLERLGRFAEAAETFRRAAEREPGRADCHTGMGRCRDRLEDTRGARAAWVEANRLDPDIETAFAAARTCLATAGTPFSPAERAASGDRVPVAFAAELFRTVTGQAQENAEAWTGLGECEWMLGRAAEAAAALERAVALAPGVPSSHILLGQARLALGQTAAARAAAAAAVRLAPNSDPALLLAGDVAHDEGRYADAVGYYRKVKVRPTAVPSLDRLATANLEAGDPALAVEVLTGRRSLATAPRLVLGRALARGSRWAEAADVLSRHGEHVSTEYRYYFGAALAGAGKLAEAEPHLLAARDDGTWRAKATRQLGHVKYRTGDFAAARTLYTECPAGSATLDLARLDLLEGHTTEARAGFDTVLTADPGNRPATLGRAIALADEGDTGPMTALAADPVLGTAANERLGGVALAAGRYVSALEYLEKARTGRSRLPDAVLAGLAACYLQLGRFAEALPPLVQLAEAYPDHPGVRHNLGLCRYQLGLNHARQGRWEPAGVDLTLASALLEPTAPAAVPGIARWATEADYRVAAEKIKTGPAPVLPAALKAIDRGCEAEPNNPRWWVASGLAHARAGFHADAAEAFTRARELVPTRAGFALGYGLSLQADGKNDEAVTAFGEVLGLAAADPADKDGLVAVATRFALARSQVKDRQWERAAESLGAIIDHPLIQSSKRLSQPDVAQSMAVFLALAGQKEKVAALAARFKGRISGSIGDVMAGLVRAEAGDYAGAAEMLTRAAKQDANPAVRDLAVACWLAAAADAVRAGQPALAVAHAAKVRELDPKNAEAAGLADAVAVYLQMQRLDPAQLDSAIVQCEKMMAAAKPSAQLVRSLGVLHHRKAVEAERGNKAPDKAWDACYDFWKGNILTRDAFWDQFATEYNLGKGRREQLEPKDVAAWRKALPTDFAAGHIGRAQACLKALNKAGLKRHLRMCGQWDPEYDPGDALLAGVGDAGEDVIGCLEDCLDAVKSPKTREALGVLVGRHWNNKGVDAGNSAGEKTERAVKMANLAITMCNALGGAGNSMGEMLARDPLRTAVRLLEEAAGELDAAVSHGQRATRAAPDSELFRKNLKQAEDLRRVVREARDNYQRQLRMIT